MNSDQEKLDSLLQRLADPAGATLTPEESQWLEDFRSRYPFFTLPTSQKGQPSLREVVTAPSREALARMEGKPDASRFDNFYPARKGPATPTTSAAIDDFLNTYGHQSEEEDQLLERLIFNPVPDYAQQLAREEETSLPSHQAANPDINTPEARLNRFILSHRPGDRPIATPVSRDSIPGVPFPEQSEGHSQIPPQPPIPTRPSTQTPPARKPQSAPQKAESAKPTPPEGLLSESLAKIYIKTRRYEQAYEILNGLSLRFPEKSSYFADQLRFLRKLILNERRLRAENDC